MKTTAIIRLILALLSATLLSSCYTCLPVGVQAGIPGVGGVRVGMPQQGNRPMSREQFFASRQGHQGDRPMSREEFFARQGGGQRQVVEKGPGEFQKTKWEKGQNQKHSNITCLISSFQGSMDNTEKKKWSKVVADWAKAQPSMPSNEQATEYLLSQLNDGRRVRVQLSSVYDERFIPQERTVVSRERVDRSQVSEEEAAELQRRGIEQFRQSGESRIVTSGKYYDE